MVPGCLDMFRFGNLLTLRNSFFATKAVKYHIATDNNYLDSSCPDLPLIRGYYSKLHLENEGIVRINQKMQQSGETKPDANRIFVLPVGLSWETPDVGNGSIVIIPKREELNLQEEPYLKHINTFEDKVQKLLVHLIRFPSESTVKITYYVSSWRDVPEELTRYLDWEYLEWFHDTVTHIPSVDILCKTLKTKAKKLPMPMINILLWLLVGLREPKLCPVHEVGFAERMFGDLKSLGRIRKIYRLEYSSMGKVPKSDLMRYEYGYFCEKIENVYGFLYHFQITGTHQFFVDQPQHAFLDGEFKYPLWSGSPVTRPICTLLVMEWTPKSARPFISHKVEVPRLADPNFFYYRCTSGARMSHVVILEPKPVHLPIPPDVRYMIDDGISVAGFILASLLCIAAWFKFRIRPDLR